MATPSERQAKRKNRPERLRDAAQENDLVTIKSLIAENTDVNDSDEYGNNALMLGAGHGNLQVVEELLDAKARINDSDSYGQTPLMFACIKGHYEVVKLLIDRKARVNATTDFNHSALLKAAQSHFQHTVHICELLLSKKADANIQESNDENTPLILAASHNNIGVCIALAENGADLNLQSKKNTPLTAAARTPSYALIKELVALGCDPELKNQQGESIYTVPFKLSVEDSEVVEASDHREKVKTAVNEGLEQRADRAREAKKAREKGGWEAGRAQREEDRAAWEQGREGRRASLAELFKDRDRAREMARLDAARKAAEQDGKENPLDVQDDFEESLRGHMGNLEHKDNDQKGR